MSRSWQQMRAQHRWSAVAQQFVEDLAIRHPLVDQRSDLGAGAVGGAASIRVAARQGEEMPGAAVAGHAAGAVDVGEEPLDALGFCRWPVNVGRHLRGFYPRRRRFHLEVYSLADAQFCQIEAV